MVVKMWFCCAIGMLCCCDLWLRFGAVLEAGLNGLSVGLNCNVLW